MLERGMHLSLPYPIAQELLGGREVPAALPHCACAGTASGEYLLSESTFQIILLEHFGVNLETGIPLLKSNLITANALTQWGGKKKVCVSLIATGKINGIFNKVSPNSI